MPILAKKILIVEDDDVNLLIAEHLLKRAGHQVTSADNGESAVEAVRATAYDLILMDIEMPIMDGLEATPLIRQLPFGQQVPIIALTAHTIPEKLAEIHQAGMDDYLIKPFELPKFDAIAEKYLNSEAH
jgi:CheY-like chemotaxis protein